jgi:hypothetical protein
MKKSKSQFKNYLLMISIIFISFLVITPAFAAEIFFKTEIPEIKIGQLFEVGVFINTKGESINAIEGEVIFPQDLLEIKKINNGNSIVNFWIEKPENTSKGQIAFSGIIPGGYNNNQGLIFSMTFLAKKENNGVIKFNNMKILRNDGQETETSLNVSNFQFLISGQVPVSQTLVPEIEDNNPPEEFTLKIAADPAIFEGKWFLVFATQDKESGIGHYEVQEGSRSFIVAESPYLLQNQNLDEKIFVKAIDTNGNEKISILSPQKSLPWYQNYWIFVILTIVGLIIAGTILRKVLWQKFLKLH